MWWAHPRGCGADGSSGGCGHYPQGSSPRVRGRRNVARQRNHATGLIPAGAGQTSESVQTGRGRRAHPRGCGADGIRKAWNLVSKGSSPRVRGRPEVRSRHAAGMGLIPAGAGQTSGCGTRCSCRRAHPRGCGADNADELEHRSIAGSSPRVRGRRAISILKGGEGGLIPAGAGQTSSKTPARSTAPAHPRGCGADLPAGHGAGGRRGSSPRVRGRLNYLVVTCVGDGLIPAGAGQTRSLRSRFWRSGAHPRGCGADP